MLERTTYKKVALKDEVKKKQEHEQTVVILRSWSIACYNFHTTVRSVVSSLSLFAVVVPNVVSVLFFKLFHEKNTN